MSSSEEDYSIRGWKSSSVAKGYIANSTFMKQKTAKRILGSEGTSSNVSNELASASASKKSLLSDPSDELEIYLADNASNELDMAEGGNGCGTPWNDCDRHCRQDIRPTTGKFAGKRPYKGVCNWLKCECYYR